MEIEQKYIERFWKKVDKKSENECWEWLAGKDSGGYGTFRYLGKHVGSHRISYMINKAEITDGLHVMHSCDNRSCVNPNHLSLGTIKDNAVDKVKKGRHTQQLKTHCAKGHEYLPENTYLNKKNHRICKTCAFAIYKAKHLKEKLLNGVISNKEKTHCPHGHEYSVENTHICKRGIRYCIACRRNRYHKKK